MSGFNLHALGAYNTLHFGTVVANDDPDSRGRVQVRLAASGLEVWAPVVAPSAGQNYGVSFVPRIDEIVVLAFVSPDLPLVLGAVWTGGGSRPEEADPQEKHYVIRTPAGVVVDIDDDGPTVEIRTPQGHFVKLTDEGGGEVEIKNGGQSIKLTSSEVNLTSSGPMNIDAATLNISAGMVSVDAGMSKFSGVVKADTVITNAVVSSSYTPGAGNIW